MSAEIFRWRLPQAPALPIDREGVMHTTQDTLGASLLVLEMRELPSGPVREGKAREALEHLAEAAHAVIRWMEYADEADRRLLAEIERWLA